MSFTIALGPSSLSLRMASITEISVDVVSCPQNAAQSFATAPAPITSLPRFTVPATTGTCRQDKTNERRNGGTKERRDGGTNEERTRSCEDGAGGL